MNNSLIAAACQAKAFIPLLIGGDPKQHHKITRLSPSQTSTAIEIFHQSHHSHDRRGMNGLKTAVICPGFVVKGDVATGNRSAQGATGMGQAAACHRQLPIPLRGFWRGEVQVVGHSDRLGSNTAEIACRFSDRCDRSPLWVKSHPAIGTIQRGRYTALRRLQRRITLLRTKANHRSISATGSNHRIGQHLLVVLAIDPALAGNRGVIKQTQQIRIPIAIGSRTRKI